MLPIAGGLTIDLFGLLLSQQHALPPQMPRPRLAEILDTFLALSEELGMERGAPKLMPFWLPIRWCEPGMRPEQVGLARVRRGVLLFSAQTQQKCCCAAAAQLSSTCSLHDVGHVKMHS